MTGEIFSIGDEILYGHIADTNASYIARELGEIGISVKQIWGLADDKDQLIEALGVVQQRSDVVILTGGLGPTKDDVTKYTLSEFFEDQLVLNQQVLDHITRLFQERDDKYLSQLNREQAMVPSAATVIPNEFGTAPGLWMEKEGLVVIALPGVPHEMQNLMDKEVIPRLRKKFQRPFIYHKHILTKGIRESHIAERLADFEEQLPSGMKLSYLPGLGNVSLRITAKGAKEDQVKAAVEKQVEKIYELAGDVISPEQEMDEKVEVQICKRLTENKQSLSTAESCTGGALAAAFTTYPGASTCYKGGMVPYDTRIKMDGLGVSQETIEKHSVVSAEVAKEMAVKAREFFDTDFALSTTGNAGPTKGDSDALVGTVYIGLATPKGAYSKKFMFGQTRTQVVTQSVQKALELMLRELMDLEKS